jgi:hypothetical protein
LGLRLYMYIYIYIYMYIHTYIHTYIHIKQDNGKEDGPWGAGYIYIYILYTYEVKILGRKNTKQTQRDGRDQK